MGLLGRLYVRIPASRQIILGWAGFQATYAFLFMLMWWKVPNVGAARLHKLREWFTIPLSALVFTSAAVGFQGTRTRQSSMVRTYFFMIFMDMAVLFAFLMIFQLLECRCSNEDGGKTWYSGFPGGYYQCEALADFSKLKSGNANDHIVNFFPYGKGRNRGYDTHVPVELANTNTTGKTSSLSEVDIFAVAEALEPSHPRRASKRIRSYEDTHESSLAEALLNSSNCDQPGVEHEEQDHAPSKDEPVFKKVGRGLVRHLASDVHDVQVKEDGSFETLHDTDATLQLISAASTRSVSKASDEQALLERGPVPTEVEPTKDIHVAKALNEQALFERGPVPTQVEPTKDIHVAKASDEQPLLERGPIPTEIESTKDIHVAKASDEQALLERGPVPTEIKPAKDIHAGLPSDEKAVGTLYARCLREPCQQSVGSDECDPEKPWSCQKGYGSSCHKWFGASHSWCFVRINSGCAQHPLDDDLPALEGEADKALHNAEGTKIFKSTTRCAYEDETQLALRDKTRATCLAFRFTARLFVCVTLCSSIFMVLVVGKWVKRDCADAVLLVDEYDADENLDFSDFDDSASDDPGQGRSSRSSRRSLRK